MKRPHAHLIRPYEIKDGQKFRLRNVDPGDTGPIRSKDEAEERLKEGGLRLSDLQAKLYAQNSWALLLIFQAMDAAGKDGTIKHVLSGVNPQGCEVVSFKIPSPQELNHDFLWRANRALPERGRIGIFNRSYYEEMLVVRVHPAILREQKLPPKLLTKHLWRDRFADINAYERYLTRNGVVIRKFFLHVSKDEQKRRLLSRLDEANKNWKFSLADSTEREFWKDYQSAYEKAIRHTSTTEAPWYVVPADNKWYTRLVVSSVIVETLESLDLQYPHVDAVKKKELGAVRKTLLAEG